MTPEVVFFEFIKAHPVLKHLKYTEEPNIKLKLIGVYSSETYTEYDYINRVLNDPRNAVLDPNYDELYGEFLKNCTDKEAVDYIKNYVETSTKEEIISLVIRAIKHISKDLDADNFYIVISEKWATHWLDEIKKV